MIVVLINKFNSVSDQDSRQQDESQDTNKESPSYDLNNEFPDNEIKNGAAKKVTHKVGKSKKKIVRGRPRKALVAMYQSHLSGDKNTIKIRIKKSDLSVQLTPNKKKSGRRKKHKITSDTDASDYEKKTKRVKYVSAPKTNEECEDDDREQSPWGLFLPQPVLYKIFENLCMQEGTLPTLVK